tara:strand:+ start:5328 stop:6362 length:1035 start_codon:yes stop_codon:yes gene_type:complete
MARQPVVPRNEHDPTSTQRMVAGASNNFNRRLNVVFNNVNKIIKELDYTKVQANQSFIVVNGLNVQRRWTFNHGTEQSEPIYIKRELRTNETTYNYNLSAFELNRLNETIGSMIERLFMVDDEGNLLRVDNAKQLWLMSGYVEPAYEKGTAQAFTNLALQSDVYASATMDVEQLFFSQAYQRRIGFVAAREFELMQGFTADVIKETRFVLGDGIALGKSPREIASELQSRINVSKSRAKRIAQTEIPGALRRANWAETDQASIDYGIRTMQMHMSAFKKTSRPNHIARSGGLYTSKQIKDWYSNPRNAINCYCTQIATVVDDEGKPLSDGAQKKVLKMKENFVR